MTPVPQTLAETLDAIAELDVQKWGEAQREPSRKLNAQNYKTYGLALNSLARREEYAFGDNAPELVAAADAALTEADLAALESWSK